MIVGTHIPVVVLALHVNYELVAFRVLRDRHCVHLDNAYLSVNLYTATVSDGDEYFALRHSCNAGS